MLFEGVRVVVRGGGDLASGVIYRLVKAGFPVVVTELARPLAIRRAVAFASAVFEGNVTIEGLTCWLAADAARAGDILAAGDIPLVIDDNDRRWAELLPAVVVDARMAKRNLGVSRADAPLVIGLGPGFSAGEDCHAVIETNRGHFLGRVIWQGGAEPDTGSPGRVGGRTNDRVLRAPTDGFVLPDVAIGDLVHAGDRIAAVAGQPITAPFEGVLRGLIHPSVPVTAGMKVGDLDARAVREHCFTISDKAMAIGGGVVEAVLSAAHLRALLREAACASENRSHEC